MKNKDPTTLALQTSGQPLHLGSIGFGLVAHNQGNKRIGIGFETSGNGPEKGLRNLILGLDNTSIAAVELIQKPCQPDPPRHGIDFG